MAADGWQRGMGSHKPVSLKLPHREWAWFAGITATCKQATKKPDPIEIRLGESYNHLDAFTTAGHRSIAYFLVVIESHSLLIMQNCFNLSVANSSEVRDLVLTLVRRQIRIARNSLKVFRLRHQDCLDFAPLTGI
jgi:hypothetical protein